MSDEPVATMEEFVEKWKDHPEIQPLPLLTYAACSSMIGEALVEGDQWQEIAPFARAVNLHFYGVADTQLRK